MKTILLLFVGVIIGMGLAFYSQSTIAKKTEVTNTQSDPDAGMKKLMNRLNKPIEKKRDFSDLEVNTSAPDEVDEIHSAINKSRYGLPNE